VGAVDEGFLRPAISNVIFVGTVSTPEGLGIVKEGGESRLNVTEEMTGLAAPM